MNDIRLSEFHDSAAHLHSLDVPTDGPRRVWHLVPTGPAVVLGSTQPHTDVTTAAAAESGVEVVSRRSGGGAVWVDVEDPLWVDVWIPRDDPDWHDDVGASFGPIGAAWVTALTRVGVRGIAPHYGPMLCHPGSRQVCFAGVGPGEIMRGDRKLVGISQRRNRHGARFQCAMYRHWDPVALHGLLVDPPPLAALATRATGLDEVAPRSIEMAVVLDAFVDALTQSI